jgi:transcriptional regulator with XRE-family HTH domain
LRRVAGFATATEFATSLGVTKNAVSKWENNGKLGPKSDRAIRVTCGLAIIDEIVNDRSGAVDAQDVRLTLTKLQQFLVKFRSMGVLSAIRDEVRESERLIVDPELPFSFSILQPASAERPQLVQ